MKATFATHTCSKCPTQIPLWWKYCNAHTKADRKWPGLTRSEATTMGKLKLKGPEWFKKNYPELYKKFSKS